MKKVILTIGFAVIALVLASFKANNTAVTSYRQPASTIKQSWSFNYKDLSRKPFSIKKEAATYEEAYKSASRECYQQLTQGKYPGEEKGLDIIDICANPKI